MSQADPDVYTTTAPGGSTVPAIEAALKALATMYSGGSAPSYTDQPLLWYDTTNDQIKFYDGSAWVVLFRVDEAGDVAAPIPAVSTYADDATPSVKGRTSIEISDTGANTITGFDDGVEGQVIVVRVTTTNTTIDGGLTATGMTIPCVAGDTLMFTYDGAAWKQVGGSIGMGRFVPVVPPDAIGDANLSPATAAAADIDLSDDGVRKGAVAASVTFHTWNNSGTGRVLYARKNGESTTGVTVEIHQSLNTVGQITNIPIPLDNDAIFEFWSAADWSAGGSTLTAQVVGYWI